MLTGAIHRKRALAVVALALPTPLLLAGGGSAAAAPLGRTCATETHMWSGTAVFDVATASVVTDLIVPVIAGTELVVVGVSADGLTADGQARPMSVTVGEAPASPGASVPGGLVAILGDGGVAEVRGVTVVVDRCTVVQSAPAPPSGQPTALPSGQPTALPFTGVQLDGSLLGALAIAVGSAMMVVGRRRTGT